MENLKTQALRLILNIDSQLEPLEDTFEHLKAADQKRYAKLKKLIVVAETRYYRRSKSVASPWSMVTKIVAAATEPKAASAVSSAWMGPYI